MLMRRRPTSVLLVETNSGAVERLKDLSERHLNSFGPSQVRVAHSLENAISIFKTHHPDLIVINAAIGKQLTRDFCHFVRREERHRHTGILFYCPENDQTDTDQLSVTCLEMGADDFIRPGCSDEEFAARLKAILRLKTMTDELRQANHKLQVLSLTDELTGLCNMRAFTQHYVPTHRKCQQGEFGLGVIMIDLDHFKSVNDSTNHLVGSYVLSSVGKLISHSHILDDQDLAARYGGDEFIIYCAGSNLKNLESRAEKLRKAIFRKRFEKDGHVITITASIGVSWAPAKTEVSAEQLIKAADMMLYRSKNGGRDRVTSCQLDHETESKNLHRFGVSETSGGGQCTSMSVNQLLYSRGSG